MIATMMIMGTKKWSRLKLPVLSILSPGAASFGEDRQGNLMSDNTIDDVDQYESRFDPIQLDYID